MIKPLRLVDTEAAKVWTGRDRETLYRWAREGRIQRHGTSGHWGARWDLDELPMATPGGPLPEPPPLPPKPAA